MQTTTNLNWEEQIYFLTHEIHLNVEPTIVFEQVGPRSVPAYVWGLTHHVWKADISQATDQGAAETRQLHKQGLVLLLNHLVLVLDALQVLFHGGDLQHTATDFYYN